MTLDLFFGDDAEWQEYLAEEPPIVRIAGPNDETVATAHDLFQFKKEDAALIVAAPDLLEALIDARESIITLCSESDRSTEPWLDMINRAIEKAKYKPLTNSAE
jgi:hypothetical protein